MDFNFRPYTKTLAESLRLVLQMRRKGVALFLSLTGKVWDGRGYNFDGYSGW